MQQYTFKGKNGNKDISFTIEDLIPMRETKQYTIQELVALIDYRDYEHCHTRFIDDLESLYSKPENKKSNFFRIKDTGLIIIPSKFCFPTILTEQDL